MPDDHANQPSARKNANRKNAKRSTGPKSTRGKARASRNAVRHGLAAARMGDALVSAEAERMAKTFGFNDMSPAQFEQFLTIAKCQVELDRVTAARIAVVDRELTRQAAPHQAAPDQPVPHQAASFQHPDVHQPLQEGSAQLMRDEVSAFIRALPELGMLDRYERRALSRRRRAIVNFVACTIIRATLKS